MKNFEDPWGNYLLKDFIETQQPELVDLLPQTAGWLVVGIILLVFIGNKIYRAIKRYQLNAYRREAIKWLAELPEYTSVSKQPIYRLIPTLLRNVALTGIGRDKVVSLTSKDWEIWLDQQCSETIFSVECGSYLRQLSYSAVPVFTATQMSQLIEHVALWINLHRGQYD